MNNKKYKYYLILLLFIFASCSSNIEKIPDIYIQENQPDLSVENMNTKYFSDEQIKSKIIAPLANSYQNNDNPYIEFPKGVEVYFYNNKFEITSSMIADYAIYYKKEKLWKAAGNVVMTNTDGSTLKTQEIYSNQETEEIYSLKYVTLTRSNGEIINAKNGLKTNLQFHPYEFNNVDGKITYNENEIK